MMCTSSSGSTACAETRLQGNGNGLSVRWHEEVGTKGPLGEIAVTDVLHENDSRLLIQVHGKWDQDVCLRRGEWVRSEDRLYDNCCKEDMQ